MLDVLTAVLLKRPRATEMAADLASRVAVAALSAGVLLHAVGLALAGLPGAKPGAIGAEHIFPGFLAALVPESSVGFAVWTFILVAGLCTLHVARGLRRQLEAF